MAGDRCTCLQSGEPRGQAPAAPWESAWLAWVRQSPPVRGPGVCTVTSTPGTVGPGPWAAGRGMPTVVRRQSTSALASAVPVAVPGALVRAMALALTPGLEWLAVPE